MRDLTGKYLDSDRTVSDNEYVFRDGNLYIICISDTEKDEKGSRTGQTHMICLDPQYDEPISLVEIEKDYPDVKKVIHELGLSGKVFTYGNHVHSGGEPWEMTGTTVGFA